ncbi:MAG TPA: alpha/beta hydrolase [Streptosporangiaceae bacterium]|nr:alpha/beta hydrolase [Streptosporangiaceae bacterium]
MGAGREAVTEVLAVDVPGGALAVEHVAAGTGSRGPVLAVHGISSQRKLWNWLRAARPDLSLIAPDLRGRGDSVGVTGPSSVARHAADLVAVLDHLGLDRVPVCGMSMGGFVAVELATAFPDRVSSLVLVDGGFPMATPPGLTPEAVPAIFRDRLARLDRAWASVGDYAEFFVASTAPLLDPADPLLLDYLAHDLDGGRVRLDADALIADATDIFFGASKWDQLTVPARLLTAEWSTGRDSPPAYPPAAVEQFRDRLPTLVTVRTVAGADHAASIMSPAGARATAELLSEAL